jgi:DNA-binding NarL/FixJ family response regulator
MTDDKTITVWMVEDDSRYREQLQKLLQARQGLDCPRVFVSCKGLFQTLETESDRPDVILMDIELPGMSGLDGIRLLAKQVPDIRVIVITVFNDQEKIMNAVDAGAAGYLLKSATIEDIEDGIRDVLTGGAVLDRHVAQLILDNIRKEKPEKNPLSPQEAEVLKLLSMDYGAKQIADELRVSTHTVYFHLKNIYKKFDVHSQAAAVSRGIRQGFI